MKSFALALLSAWLAMPVAAQTINALSRTEINPLSASSDSRAITICLVPDIQNLSSQSDFNAIGGRTSCPVTTGYCTGASCTSSPYCSGSWRNTGETLLRNMAYSLTGQWSSIDYTAIDGPDTVRSKKPYPLDHGPCDVIIGLGDNLDTADMLDYNQLTADMLHEYAMARTFWTIIRDSGIPFIIARGNHEGEGTFRQLLTDLGVTALPFYYLGHSDGDQYAIKFSTRTGKDFCVVTLDDDIGNQPTVADGDQYTASEAAWVISTAGCGADLPTLVAGHWIVGPDSGATLYDVDAVIADASADEVFLVAGGHYTASAISRKVETTNVGGKTVWKLFSNWQERDRHGTNVRGNGITASDGIGGAYTIVHLDANSSRLCGYDWNPYFQMRSTVGNGQDIGSELFSSACLDFDFDARWP